MKGSGSTSGRSNWSAARLPSVNIIFSRRAATACSSSASARSRWRSAAPPTPVTQQRIDALLAEHGAGDFVRNFLSDAGLTWAAALAGRFNATQTPEGE